MQEKHFSQHMLLQTLQINSCGYPYLIKVFIWVSPKDFFFNNLCHQFQAEVFLLILFQLIFTVFFHTESFILLKRIFNQELKILYCFLQNIVGTLIYKINIILFLSFLEIYKSLMQSLSELDTGTFVNVYFNCEKLEII